MWPFGRMNIVKRKKKQTKTTIFYLIFKELNICRLHLRLKLAWPWYNLHLMLQKEYLGPQGHYDKHQICLSGTTEIEDWWDYTKFIPISGYITLKIFPGICFCVYYIPVFHKSEVEKNKCKFDYFLGAAWILDKWKFVSKWKHTPEVSPSCVWLCLINVLHSMAIKESTF